MIAVQIVVILSLTPVEHLHPTGFRLLINPIEGHIGEIPRAITAADVGVAADEAALHIFPYGFQGGTDSDVPSALRPGIRAGSRRVSPVATSHCPPCSSRTEQLPKGFSLS